MTNSKGKERLFRQREFIAIIPLIKRKPILHRTQYLTVLVTEKATECSAPVN